MPSFVPYADFDVRTNWYKLTNPKNSVLTMKEAVRLSRAVTAMRNSRAQCSECAYLYRDNEVSRLMKRVDQLDQELPLQTMRTLVPYENTLGGFEMFNTGVTDLSPELIGWYGAPGVYISDNGCNQFRCGCTQKCQDGGLAPLVQECVKKGTQDVLVEVAKTLPICEGEGTTLFLVGDNFSVHDTRVIAGGVCIPHVQLVSRQIMRVTIPSCVQTVHLCENGCVNEYVAVYVATPYGVTNHLHVPVHRVDSTTEQEPGTDCSAAPTPCAVDGPTAVPQLAAAERSLIRLPPTRRAQLPSRNELQLAPPAPTTQPAGGDDGGAFRGAQNENRWRVQLAAASVPIEPELSPVGRPTSTTVGPLPAVRVALQSPPSDTADQLLQELRTLTTQLKDERAAIQAALEREGNAAALAGQSVVNVNVRQPADRGLSLCDGTQFPCFHRMFVSARECWRNVRDELPCN